MNKPITPKEMSEWIAKTWKKCQDEAWSNELDRPWVELEFGIGKLAELKNESV